jgi:hypothetical protein
LGAKIWRLFLTKDGQVLGTKELLEGGKRWLFVFSVLENTGMEVLDIGE